MRPCRFPHRDPAGGGQPGDVRLTREALKEGKVRNNLHVAPTAWRRSRFLRGEGKYADAPGPDVILLDLNLPRKDGREVLEEIKADPRCAPSRW
jgi:two-component system, chemotaxis family, response regulator Rcp1